MKKTFKVQLSDGNLSNRLTYLDNVTTLGYIEFVSLVLTVNPDTHQANPRYIIYFQHLSISTTDMQNCS